MTEAEIARGAMLKVSWRILPLLGLGWFVAMMDKLNVGFAALRMNAELGFNASVYGLGAGLFFLSYALFALPSSMVLTRVGVRRWIAFIMIAWGLLAVGLMFVRTPLQFYVVRFLIGMAESGFMPGIGVYAFGWFPSRYRGRAISRFYVAGGVTSILMGPIAAGLLSLDGSLGLEGWQWLFLVTGSPAVLIGLLVLFFLPESVADAHWLNGKERAWIERELERDAEAFEEPATHDILAMITHPGVILVGLIGMLLMGPDYALILSIPKLLNETGFDVARVGWITSAGGVLMVIATLSCGALLDRMGEPYSTVLVSSAIVCLAYVALALVLGGPALPVVAVYFIWALSMGFADYSSMLILPEVLHPRLRPVGAGVAQTVAMFGCFVTPFAWGVLRDASGSFRIGLFGLAALTVLAWLITYSLSRRTRMASLQPAGVPDPPEVQPKVHGSSPARDGRMKRSRSKESIAGRG